MHLSKRLLIHILYLVLLHSYISCDNKSKDKGTASNNETKAEVQRDIFVPDTAINNKIFLRNSSSVEKSVGDLMPFIAQEESLPDVYLSSQSGSEYLKLLFSPGDTRNTFSFFEVGLADSIPDINIKTTSYEHFTTESEIKLGINQEKLVQIKGGGYTSNVQGAATILSYVVNDYNTSSFLQSYNMPIYVATYHFEGDKLIKFGFGFEYP